MADGFQLGTRTGLDSLEKNICFPCGNLTKIPQREKKEEKKTYK